MAQVSNRWNSILKALKKAGYVKTRRTDNDVVVFENKEGCIVTIGLGVIAARKVVGGKVKKSNEYNVSEGDKGVRKVIDEISEVQDEQTV